jgi:hypothetical protein
MKDISDQMSAIRNLAPLDGGDILQRDGVRRGKTEKKEKAHTESTEITEFAEKRKTRMRR